MKIDIIKQRNKKLTDCIYYYEKFRNEKFRNSKRLKISIL